MPDAKPKVPDAADVAIVIACAIIPIAVLGWGMTSGNPYGYFVFLRVVVCFSAIVFAALCSGKKWENLQFLFFAIGLLYNPFFPIHLERRSWLLFNVMAMSAFGYTMIS